MLPCFIINFNRFHAPKAIVEYLTPDTGCFPVIIDNASTYPPLLEWYATNPCPIEHKESNRGNFVLWRSPLILHKYADHTNDGYLVTDSDLDLSRVPKDFLRVLRKGLELHPEYIKCGLSLEINDLPNNELRKVVMNWEKINWTNMVSHGYYRAAVDTTFAYYKYNLLSPIEQHDFDKNLRTDRPYTARHLPWYYDKNNLPDDERYYLNSIEGFNHYSALLKKQIQ